MRAFHLRRLMKDHPAPGCRRQERRQRTDHQYLKYAEVLGAGKRQTGVHAPCGIIIGKTNLEEHSRFAGRRCGT